LLDKTCYFNRIFSVISTDFQQELETLDRVPRLNLGTKAWRLSHGDNYLEGELNRLLIPKHAKNWLKKNTSIYLYM